MRIYAKFVFRPRSDAGRFVQAYISPAVRAAVTEACNLVEARAKANCPVDTGALRDSIETKIVDTAKTVKGTVTTGQPYAGYVEFGTGVRGAASPGAGEGPYNPNWPGQAAQPFMRPAYDDSRQEIEQIFADDVAAALRAI